MIVSSERTRVTRAIGMLQWFTPSRGTATPTDFECGATDAVERFRPMRDPTAQAAVCLRWASEPPASHDTVPLSPRPNERRWWQPNAEVKWRHLIAVTAAASRDFPQDDWIIGQRVRALYDAGERDRALAEARACHAQLWWCAVLEGYVLARNGDLAHAEGAFLRAMSLAPLTVRCEWTDLRLLLQRDEHAAYDATTCDERSALNDRLWWLARPLFRDPSNERRVEHFTRVASIALASALSADHSFDWRLEAGASVWREALVRFGLPTRYPLYGTGVRGTIAGLHGRVTSATAIAPPVRAHAVLPYSEAAIATFAPLSVARDVAVASPADLAVRRAAAGPVAAFPEHFVPRSGLVQLPDRQVAYLRRDSVVEVLVAAPSPSRSSTRTRTFDAELWWSPGPDTAWRIARGEGDAASVLQLRGRVTPDTALLSFEVAAVQSEPAARVRVVSTPPPPLREMPAGEVSISPPILVDASLAYDAGATLAALRPSHRRGDARSIGLYWETYGHQPGDSVTHLIWIERVTPQGRLREIGMALRIATDRNAPVAVRWEEQTPPRTAFIIDGRVPIIGRALAVDVQSLTRGEYRIGVAASVRGRPPVQSSIAFFVD